MERTLEVRTGESIAIRYELAGVGSRFLALALDTALQTGVAVLLFVALLVFSGPLGRAVVALHLPAKTLTALAVSALVIAAFVIVFGYFIVFEMWWSGCTPGKRALGLRVVRDGGFPLDAGGAVVRNLVRIVEAGLGFYAVSAVVTLLSRENKRLGDYAAGTIVVRESTDPAPVFERFAASEVRADDGLAPADRALVERYVRRRESLEPQARALLAARLAARVRPQLRADFAYLSDDDLLDHLGRGALGPR